MSVISSVESPGLCARACEWVKSTAKSVAKVVIPQGWEEKAIMAIMAGGAYYLGISPLEQPFNSALFYGAAQAALVSQREKPKAPPTARPDAVPKKPVSEEKESPIQTRSVPLQAPLGVRDIQGVHNGGSDCFVISTLQVLRHDPEFMAALRAQPTRSLRERFFRATPERELVCTLREQLIDKQTPDIAKIRTALHKKNRYLLPFGQHDAAEVFNAIFDSLEGNAFRAVKTTRKFAKTAPQDFSERAVETSAVREGTTALFAVTLDDGARQPRLDALAKAALERHGLIGSEGYRYQGRDVFPVEETIELDRVPRSFYLQLARFTTDFDAEQQHLVTHENVAPVPVSERMQIHRQDRGLKGFVVHLPGKTGNSVYIDEATGAEVLKIDGKYFVQSLQETVSSKRLKELVKLGWIKKGQKESHLIKSGGGSGHYIAFVETADGRYLYFNDDRAFEVSKETYLRWAAHAYIPNYRA